MSNIYYKGDTAFLYVKYVDENNNLCNVEDAKIRILHDEDNNIYEDLEWTNLNQMGMGEYYYNYKIPFDCVTGEYLVVYIAKNKNKESYIVEKICIQNKPINSQGLIKVFGYIYDIKNNKPLKDSKILIYQDNELIYECNSNNDGLWEAYLYPDEYKFIFKKIKYEDMEINVQIGNETNEIQFDNISLINESFKEKGTGNFNIKDKFIIKNGQPICDIEVVISSINNPMDILAKTKTNEEGEWECYLDDGSYILKTNGKFMNTDFNKTLRLIVDVDGKFNIEDLSNNTGVLKDQGYITQGDGKIKVSDTVLDKNGEPICNVQVNILNNKNDILAQDYTDLKGKWELYLDPGVYKIEYYHPMFLTITSELNVN